MPAVAPLPAAIRGHVTFGSFNSYAKIGARVIALWAEVLRAVPDSRLIMVTVPGGAAQDELRARFAGFGVDPARLVLRDRLPRATYLELFAEVDLALDPFPCNGATTTCDALWMGVPVICLVGDTFLSRASFSLLATCGLDAWAARDDEDYVRICATAAADPLALAAARATLRPRLAASPLLDAPGFTRDLEAIYRDWWYQWCATPH
jgi:predicted O-linked N-acetylglucosamine transferase (SPINDLY family)